MEVKFEYHSIYNEIFAGTTVAAGFENVPSNVTKIDLFMYSPTGGLYFDDKRFTSSSQWNSFQITDFKTKKEDLLNNLNTRSNYGQLDYGWKAYDNQNRLVEEYTIGGLNYKGREVDIRPEIIEDEWVYVDKYENIVTIGEVLQGEFSLVYKVSGKAKYNATMATLIVRNPDVSISSYGSGGTSAKITKAGNTTFEIRARDSRGIETIINKIKYITPYTRPTLANVSLDRSPEKVGDNLAYSFKGFIHANAKAPLKCTVKVTGKPYTNITVTKGNNTYSSVINNMFGDGSNVVTLAISDYYNETKVTRNIMPYYQLINFNKSGKGIALGRNSTENSFQVGMATKLYEAVTITNTLNATGNIKTDGTLEIGRNLYIDGNMTFNNGKYVVYKNGSDANDLSDDWVLGSGTNYPASGFWYVEQVQYTATTKKQIAYGYRNNEMYTRHSYNGAWSDWEIYGMFSSNSRGDYIKYADGTLMTMQRIYYKHHIDRAWGTLFYGATIDTGDYPVPFVTTPTVSSHVDAGSQDAWLVKVAGSMASKTTAGSYYLVRPTTATNAEGYLHITAVGKWK